MRLHATTRAPRPPLHSQAAAERERDEAAASVARAAARREAAGQLQRVVGEVFLVLQAQALASKEAAAAKEAAAKGKGKGGKK